MSNSSHDDSLSPASRGTGDENLSTEKRCTKCGETKSLDSFHKEKNKKDGLRSHCKACIAAYYAANRDHISTRHAAHYAANRDQIRTRHAARCNERRIYNAAYYAANRDQIRKQQATYHAAHLDKIRKQHAAYRAASYIANPDKIHAYYVAYHAANRDKVFAQRAANPDIHRAAYQRRRARIKGNGGAGVSSDELRVLRATQNGFCAYCNLPWIAPLHIDHVIPLKQGGPHEIANIVLACPDCNLNKGNRTSEQWTDRWYYHRDFGRLV